MPLEDLLETIEALRRSIDTHGTALRGNEALTRYALIDPLLRALGWDTEDPSHIVPEFPVKKGYFDDSKRYVDYALLSEGKPAILVEAKNLGTPLRDKVIGQGTYYCWRQRISHFVVTNGQRWEIYDTEKREPDENDDAMRIVEFDVTEPAADVCLDTLALWRPGVLSGSIRVGERPVVVDSAPVSAQGSSVGPLDSAPQHPPGPSHKDGRWVPLGELDYDSDSPEPLEILFPDDSVANLSSWTSIVVQTTDWLVSAGRILEANLPLRSRENYILATSETHPPSRRHPGGRQFDASRQFGRIYLEAHGNPPTVLRKARVIVQHAGLDPADFKVRLAD